MPDPTEPTSILNRSRASGVGAPLVGVLMLAALVTVVEGPTTAWAAACSTVPRGGELESDFNGDGWNDIAVGVPYEDVGAIQDAGIVQIFYSSGSGLMHDQDRTFSQGTPGVPGHNEADDRWGSTQATGDFDGDGYCDLAVGAPGEDVGDTVDAGSVTILYGSRDGITASNAKTFHQNVRGVGGIASQDEQFGLALAAQNFGRTAHADLAVGAPGEDIGGHADAGQVHVLYGGNGGLSARDDQVFHQDTPGIKDAAEAGDRFGAVLAVGNLGKTSSSELVIGVPEEDIGAIVDAGVVHVLFSFADGLSDIDAIWHQDSPGVKGQAETAGNFGFSLAVGEFGNRRSKDLAIGAPGATVDRLENDIVVEQFDDAGQVHVLYGSAHGPTAGDQIWSETSIGRTASAAGDRFGYRLAAGEMGLPNVSAPTDHADLAIAAPFDDRQGQDGGSMTILYGSAEDGLTNAGAETLDGDNDYSEDDLTNQRFSYGGVIVRNLGDLGRRGYEGFSELIVGSPFQGTDASGIVTVVYAHASGLNDGHIDRFLVQGTSGTNGSAEPGDMFGWLGGNAWHDSSLIAAVGKH